MIEMFRTLFTEHITNTEAVYLMAAVVVTFILLLVAVAVADKLSARHLKRAAHQSQGMFIGSTYIPFN